MKTLSDKIEEGSEEPIWTNFIFMDDVKEFIQEIKEGKTMDMKDDNGKLLGRLIVISEHQLDKLAGDKLI